MKCTDAYRYLFQYALDKIPQNIRSDVASHLETCPECRDIVTALQMLIPHLPEGRIGEITHYNIVFPSIGICYSNCGSKLADDAEYANSVLEKTGGYIPDDEHWLGGCSTNKNMLVAIFDNEGYETEYVIKPVEGTENYRYDIRKFNKIYAPIHWERSVYSDSTNYYHTKRSYEAPNLYAGRVGISLGSDANSGIYIALPAGANNIRLKRGNGVIDCGTYKFVYVQRYVIENETVNLEYTYNM